MLKVISFKICPFVQRVTALLEAKNIDYDVEYISLSDKSDWFLELSPNGQVPVLVTETGTALFESEAIVEYIEEAFVPLLPGLMPEQKALNRAWGYLAAKNYLVQCGAQRSRDSATLEERAAKLGTAFDKIEKALPETGFFNGDALGPVDIAWLTLLHRADIMEQSSGFDFLGMRPKLKRWQQTVLATGLAEKSVAADFHEKFSNFYLSDETYLGRGCDATAPASGCASRAAACC